MKARYFILLALFASLSSTGCISVKNGLIKTGENVRDIAIHNAVLDFSNSCRLYRNDSVFSVSFEDSVFFLALNYATGERYRDKFYEDRVLASISAHRMDESCGECCDRFLYTAETAAGSKGKLPSRHIEKDGKLFYWWDDDYPLTEEMLAILWKYDLLCDDTEGLTGIPDFTTDDRLKGAHYYFCKNDLSKYKRVVTNIADGYYRPPKLKCN
jgi:hypothetical protein